MARAHHIDDIAHLFLSETEPARGGGSSVVAVAVQCAAEFGVRVAAALAREHADRRPPRAIWNLGRVYPAVLDAWEHRGQAPVAPPLASACVRLVWGVTGRQAALRSVADDLRRLARLVMPARIDVVVVPTATAVDDVPAWTALATRAAGDRPLDVHVLDRCGRAGDRQLRDICQQLAQGPAG